MFFVLSPVPMKKFIWQASYILLGSARFDSSWGLRIFFYVPRSRQDERTSFLILYRVKKPYHLYYFYLQTLRYRHSIITYDNLVVEVILWKSFKLNVMVCSSSNIYLMKHIYDVVRLFGNRSLMTLKCGEDKKVAHEAQPSEPLTQPILQNQVESVRQNRTLNFVVLTTDKTVNHAFNLSLFWSNLAIRCYNL